jgi:hypothetical protein
VDGRGAELAGFGRERAHVRAEEHARDIGIAERGSLREHAERALLQLALVMLEKDENAHR